jgi:hypothetical protein
MELSSDQIIFLNDWGKKCMRDNELELECVFTSKKNKLNVSDFKRVLKMASTKWFLNKEGESTLDILCGDDMRVTICGLNQIRKYCKEDSLENIPVSCITIIRKSLEEYKDLYEYGCRVNVKREETIEYLGDEFSVYLSQWKSINKSFRLKSRYSVLIDKTYNLDLTVVKSNAIDGKNLKESKSFMGSRTKEAKEEYEIELEYISSSIDNERQFTIEKFTSILNTVYCVKNNVERIVKKTEQNSLQIEYKDIMLGAKSKSGIFTLTQNKSLFLPGPQVTSMKLEKYRAMRKETSNYTLTSKTDGLRMIGYIAKNGILYYISNDTDRGFIKSGISFPVKYSGTIFDGEYVHKNKNGIEINHYLIFDCYFLEGIDIRFETLTKRIMKANNVVREANNIDSSNIYIKQFVKLTEDNFHDECHRLLTFLDGIESIYKDDGLIFTPDEPLPSYTMDKRNLGILITSRPWQRLLKWKPPIENTIDFRVIFSKSIESSELQLVSLKTKISPDTGHTLNDFLKLQSISKTKNYTHRGEIDFLPEDTTDITSCMTYIETKKNIRNNKNIPICINGDEIEDGAIVEMMYYPDNPVKKRWVPRNVRFDKTKPNSMEVAEEIWKIIHNPVRRVMLIDKKQNIPSDLDDLDEYYVSTGTNNTDIKLRRFHTTFVKHKLFNDTHENIRNPKILDLASGVGGDLNRYRSCNAGEIVGVEKSLSNLHNPQMGSYKKLISITNKPRNNLPKILFLHGDVSKNLLNGEAFKDSSLLYQKEAKKALNQSLYFDSVSIMFAIHYMFESKKSFSELLKNVNENVKNGGYFFGCCYDGEKLFSLLSEKPKLTFTTNDDENEVGDNTQFLSIGEGVSPNENVQPNANSLKKENEFLSKTEFLSIERKFSPDEKFQPNADSLGKELFVTVQNIGKGYTEYLVNFSYFKDEMRKIGFECIHTKSFEEYYNMDDNDHVLMNEEKEASFLNRSFVFQKTKENTKLNTQKIKIKRKTNTKN